MLRTITRHRRSCSSRVPAFLAFFILLFTTGVLSAAPQEGAPPDGKQLFSRIDEMLAKVGEITGLKVLHPVPRDEISRDKTRQYIQRGIDKDLKPEEIRAEEILLKKFGFVGPDFNLKSQTVDLLTEQAAAFYDFKQKKLYIASWTPSDMQDVALVHELAHAVADQHFHLKKFIGRSDDDDASAAREAVVEGQASWVMSEYLARQMGQSLKKSPALAQAAVDVAAGGSQQFPVFGSEPLYMQETLMFPYTYGLLFQQAVVEKLGAAAFAEVFRHPPQSSQQVLHPDRYFARAAPAKAPLPALKLPRGYKKLTDGTIGELEHSILLQQFLSKAEAAELAPRWRGGRYALWEERSSGQAVAKNGSRAGAGSKHALAGETASLPRAADHDAGRRSVLVYSVAWATPADAARFLADYKTIASKKWKHFRINSDSPDAVSGAGDDGSFRWALRGSVFTSIEGLP